MTGLDSSNQKQFVEADIWHIGGYYQDIHKCASLSSFGLMWVEKTSNFRINSLKNSN